MVLSLKGSAACAGEPAAATAPTSSAVASPRGNRVRTSLILSSSGFRDAPAALFHVLLRVVERLAQDGKPRRGYALRHDVGLGDGVRRAHELDQILVVLALRKV